MHHRTVAEQFDEVLVAEVGVFHVVAFVDHVRMPSL